MRTGAARRAIGNFHEGGFYSSDAEFLALIVPFVTEGLAAGEPVIVGFDARKCDLLRATLPRPEEVVFPVDRSVYSSPAGTIEAYRQLFERYTAAGAGQVRITGELPYEAPGQFDGWDRYESVINTVWQAYPVWSRCLYDARSVPDDVRDVVECTHPRLITAARGGAPNPRYQDVTQFEPLPPTADPLEATPPCLLLTDVSPTETRHRFAEVARGRVDSETFEELMLALSEAVTNAQRHGRAPTTVTAWTGTDRIVVHVHDTGQGPRNPLAGLVPASDDASDGGLGLWLSHQLPNVAIALIPGAAGFTVRLRSVP